MFSPPGAQQYQVPRMDSIHAGSGPQSAMMSQLQGRRMPQEQAWDAAPYNVYSDGLDGSSTTPAGDSLSGQVNPGSPGQGQGGDPRALLIQHILQSISQAGQGSRTAHPAMGQPWGQRQASGQGNPWPNIQSIASLPGFPGGQATQTNDSGFGAGSHPVVDRFHMVDAAHNLAKELAGRGASTLRRYQGRH